MAHLSKPELWAKIRDHRFPDLPDGTSFEDYQKKRTRMSAKGTMLALFEYRCFLYLSAISSDELVPSTTVAEIWKVHMNHTVEYWDYFCPEILGQELLYVPRKQRDLKKQRYLKTLALYEAEFGDPAPRYIWPQGHDQLIAVIAFLTSIVLLVLAGNVHVAFVFGLVATVPMVIKFHGPFRSDESGW